MWEGGSWARPCRWQGHRLARAPTLSPSVRKDPRPATASPGEWLGGCCSGLPPRRFPARRPPLRRLVLQGASSSSAQCRKASGLGLSGHDTGARLSSPSRGCPPWSQQCPRRDDSTTDPRRPVQVTSASPPQECGQAVPGECPLPPRGDPGRRLALVRGWTETWQALGRAEEWAEAPGRGHQSRAADPVMPSAPAGAQADSHPPGHRQTHVAAVL